MAKGYDAFISYSHAADARLATALEATRLLMFGQIAMAAEQPDKREQAEEWTDDRLRARVVRFLRKMGMA